MKMEATVATRGIWLGLERPKGRRPSNSSFKPVLEDVRVDSCVSFAAYEPGTWEWGVLGAL